MGAKHGSPTKRFNSKFVRDGLFGCWNWIACKDINGYGYFFNGSKTVSAQRFSYEVHVGPISPGLTIDHLCRNRSCVNPAHLEPVTMRVNVLRGDTITAKNLAKTHCIRGHEFTKENTYIRKDKPYLERSCKTCSREWKRKNRKKNRPHETFSKYS